jgi:predicted RNA binding protein YcfA (HicA-like mRNA interferase family)
MRILVRSHVETDARKIVARLRREGWTNVGGGNHDKFSNTSRPNVLIIVPRHKVLSPGVARDIAKKAGWPL